jgi:hypothetical protein
MAVTGNALKMKCQLAELAAKHGVTRATFRPLPLSAPTACAQHLTGYASSGDVDQDRCRFAPFAFGMVSAARTKLLFRHDPNQVAGTIERLSYDADGRLQIACRVDHEQARRCGGFSVSARIREYILIAPDTPSFYALITDASLDEISLTEIPSNPFALVTSRFPASAQAKLFENLRQYFDVLSKVMPLLPQVAAMPPATSDGAVLRKDTRRRWPAKGEHLHGGVFCNGCITDASLPRRQVSKSSFTELAEALNGRLQET